MLFDDNDWLFEPQRVRGKMIFLVAYDISNPKRLRKIAKICEDFGIRVEYSVFECDLKEEDFQRLMSDLRLWIEPEEDCILAYRICKSCVTQIESYGRVERPQKTLLYMP